MLSSIGCSMTSPARLFRYSCSDFSRPLPGRYMSLLRLGNTVIDVDPFGWSFSRTDRWRLWKRIRRDFRFPWDIWSARFWKKKCALRDSPLKSHQNSVLKSFYFLHNLLHFVRFVSFDESRFVNWTLFISSLNLSKSLLKGKLTIRWPRLLGVMSQVTNVMVMVMVFHFVVDVSVNYNYLICWSWNQHIHGIFEF